MTVISQPESITNSVNPDSKENISKLKSSRRGSVGNLTECVNYYYYYCFFSLKEKGFTKS